jgi:hypothetical protein
VHGVRTELLDDPRADHLALQPMGHPASRGRCLPDVRDVADEHRCGAAQDDDRLAEVVDPSCTTWRSDGPFHRTLPHKAARGVDVGRLDGMNHFIEAHAASRDAFGIELHLKLP